MFEPSKLYKNDEPMPRSYRIAISIEDGDTTHYVIRSRDDLDAMLLVISGMVQTGKVSHIKWVPIPDLEEVHHD